MTNRTVIHGNLIIDKPGLVENKEIRGDVHVRSSNVVIQNCRIMGALTDHTIDFTIPGADFGYYGPATS
jgi:hypothetical protein